MKNLDEPRALREHYSLLLSAALLAGNGFPRNLLRSLEEVSSMGIWGSCKKHSPPLVLLLFLTNDFPFGNGSRLIVFH